MIRYLIGVLIIYLCSCSLMEPDSKLDAKFDLLKTGMSPAESIKIMGKEPTLRESTSISVAETERLVWHTGRTEYVAKFMFNKLIIRERAVRNTKFF